MADSIFAAAQKGNPAFELHRKASLSKMIGLPRPVALSETSGSSPDGESRVRQEKMWQLMQSYIPVSKEAIQRSIANHVEYTLARTRFNFDKEDCYKAAAYSVRDRLIELLNDTSQLYVETDAKRCYYMSLEFLTGRAMQNALVNMDIEEAYREALSDMGYNLEELYEYEHDAALGNGGLGRLAACFLDSMATLNLPCWGYGIRYTYGIFEQKLVNGRQVEHPDFWLLHDNPWEVRREDCTYVVRFFGESQPYTDEQDGATRWRWVGGQVVQAVAYDNPVPGFDTATCINLRLWKAAPAKEFDFFAFNEGHYLDAVAERQDAEAISAVLYPNDNTCAGKLLRLKQQYFFCCASIQDALRRFKHRKDWQWDELPDKMCVQLNDTHPTVAIPELMRLLIDVECLDWDFAWDITRRVFNYTNHTVMAEALEKWPTDVFGKLLPRHLQIVQEINCRFLAHVSKIWTDDSARIQKLSIFEEGPCQMIRMANLACIGSSRINGVAELHSNILKETLFREFDEFARESGEAPEGKITNMTNGVTPRRWLFCCNRQLSDLMSEALGTDEWLKNYEKLTVLEHKALDDDFLQRWQEAKLANKRRLTRWLQLHCHVNADPEGMLFDVQVKRIHEYKRQLLNVLYFLHRYLSLKAASPEERKKFVPRISMIGGKAAPGYATAKTIIKLCTAVGELVNNDPDTLDFFKVVFLPNYNVSNAQVIIPGADLSQQISTAGTEASGTSCMKFVMNGALLLGTLDGANVEIREECGEDTMFVFGLDVEGVEYHRAEARKGNYPIPASLQRVFDYIRSGALCNGDHGTTEEFSSLVSRLCNNGRGCNGDYYMIARDWEDYDRAQFEVDCTYKDQKKWTQLAIKAAVRMGKFSSDRTVSDYASQIWHVEPVERD